MKLDESISQADLKAPLERFFSLAQGKIADLQKSWRPEDGAPVFTVKGRYTSRGWTEWTQGFQFGCQALLFDVTDDRAFLDMARTNTERHMAPHVSHVGVHDHGFNNVSTYGNLRRLALEGRSGDGPDRILFYELALKVSGAVQAARWSDLGDGAGFIHSFNGPHSLFSDTVRSCRSLMLAHHLGHALMGENDRRISLLGRALFHLSATSVYNVYYGKGRDIYDIPGRVVHESIFNMKDGNYRCPSSQQGWSPFSTWTRGLAWVLLGFAEELEFLQIVSDDELEPYGGRKTIEDAMLQTARVVADYYIENSSLDGVPVWDTGAPGLVHMADYASRVSEPENDFEPFDSSAAAIATQGFLRLGRLLEGRDAKAATYWRAGLAIARTLLHPPYLSTDPGHQGLLLHSVYHRPNGWDYVPEGKRIPCGESSMWGDYHLMELAVLLDRVNCSRPYLTFWGV